MESGKEKENEHGNREEAQGFGYGSVATQFKAPEWLNFKHDVET